MGRQTSVNLGQVKTEQKQSKGSCSKHLKTLGKHLFSTNNPYETLAKVDDLMSILQDRTQPRKSPKKTKILHTIP